MRDVHVSVLDLGNSKDEKLYKAIWKAAGYNCVKVFNMREQWVFETKNWKVLIHWYVDALMMRTEANQQKLALVKSLLALTNGESENDENIGEESRS